MAVSEYPINIQQSWGIASARHTSGCIVPPTTTTPHLSTPSEWLFDAPIGPSVVRWDARAQRRVLQFQAHSDLITCMRLSPDTKFIATTCYSGEVKLWSREGWKCEDETQAPMAQQHHLAWRPDSSGFLIVGNGFSSSVVMYTVNSTAGGEHSLEMLWQVEAGSTGTEIDSVEHAEGKTKHTDEMPKDSNVAIMEQQRDPSRQQDGKNYHYADAFTMAEVNPSMNVFAVEEKKDGQVYAHLFSAMGEHLKCVKTGEKSVVLLSTYSSGLEAYTMVVQGGCVLTLSAEGLDVKHSFKAGYVSRSCVWDGETLILPSDSGKLVWWSVSGKKLFEASVGSPDYIVRLEWSVSGKALWMCGFSTLSYVEVVRRVDGSIESVQSSLSVHCHDITCCGVAFSDGGEQLCAGDLAGGVWAMQGVNSTPSHTCSVGASVRCVLWWGETCVLIGCLDGRLCEWRVGEEVRKVCDMEGSVIVMKWSHTRNLLAIGSSKGVLSLYSVRSTEESQGVLHHVTSFVAHPPQQNNEDMRFGQLSKQAEIWSLCWSPDDNQLATCSEDQTTKIWSTSEWTCQSTLCGHTMAVTSVDWREETGGGSLLATCSDDRTIRVMDGKSFDIIRILSTYDLHGWHTLTYLTLHPSTSPHLLLTCTTQNGYVVVWNVRSGYRVTCGRIHCGSVEGLAWNKSTGSLATVGADCITHLFKVIIEHN